MRATVWKATALIIGALTIAATAPSKPTAPIVGNLTYKKGLNLIEQPVTHTRVGSIQGERCYTDANGGYREHAFTFDDPGDTVKVVVTDTDGVPFGRNYEYRLFFKDPSGRVKEGGAFPIRLDNRNGTGPRHDWEFILSVGAATTDTDIRSGMALGGFYELSESDRNLAVELYFDLEATNTPIAIACETYD